MAEYIEREALLCMVRPDNPSDEKTAITIATAKKLIRNIVSLAPTANVEPVRYGRWKYFRKQNIAVCTNCSFERNLDDNFGNAVSCPNCGAKMDGGHDG